MQTCLPSGTARELQFLLMHDFHSGYPKNIGIHRNHRAAMIPRGDAAEPHSFE